MKKRENRKGLVFGMVLVLVAVVFASSNMRREEYHE